jgi:nucleoside-diphosphate-sugar epimerase
LRVVWLQAFHRGVHLNRGDNQEDDIDSSAAAPGARAVLVTGGTGFIGSATLRALTGARSTRPGAPPPGAPSPGTLPSGTFPPGAVKALVRRVPDAADAVPGVEYVTGDLTEPDSLRGLCHGVGTVLHCASYIGGDEDRCRAVNVDGTRALLVEADRAGAGRTVLVSTTAVYGAGPHRDLTEEERVPAPSSPTSRSRAQAEQDVLAAGGTVIRPPLMYGEGDVWVVPAVAELLRRVPALPEDGRARLSLVAVDDLARLLATLARAPERVPGGTAHHAAHPQAPALREFVELLGATLGLPVPAAGLPLDDYLARLREAPGKVSAHQAGLLAEDRWYRSTLWSRIGCEPGPGLRARLTKAADWYRVHLARQLPAGDPPSRREAARPA